MRAARIITEFNKEKNNRTARGPGRPCLPSLVCIIDTQASTEVRRQCPTSVLLRIQRFFDFGGRLARIPQSLCSRNLPFPAVPRLSPNLYFSSGTKVFWNEELKAKTFLAGDILPEYLNFCQQHTMQATKRRKRGIKRKLEETRCFLQGRKLV